MGERERWVKVGEVSFHLDVTTDTICRWIEKKGSPAHKAGRLLRFEISEVDE